MKTLLLSLALAALTFSPSAQAVNFTSDYPGLVKVQEALDYGELWVLLRGTLAEFQLYGRIRILVLPLVVHTPNDETLNKRLEDFRNFCDNGTLSKTLQDASLQQNVYAIEAGQKPLPLAFRLQWPLCIPFNNCP